MIDLLKCKVCKKDLSPDYVEIKEFEDYKVIEHYFCCKGCENGDKKQTN